MFVGLTRQAPLFLGILRIVAALLFIEHGTQKLFGFPPGEHAGVAMGSLPWIAGLLEVVLGGLIALGLFTRPAAFIASGEMAVAYWMAHAPQDLFPANNGGDAAILFCFVFLYLVFAGPGALSIDGSRRQGR
jgi:putative oxidoreductase